VSARLGEAVGRFPEGFDEGDLAHRGHRSDRRGTLAPLGSTLCPALATLLSPGVTLLASFP
jgi:hypothetical protein